MRGGAIPVLVWSLLVGILGVLNAAWTGDWEQVAEFGFAVLVIASAATLLTARDPDALRRGPPSAPPEPRTQAVPDLSVAAMLFGISAGVILYGLVFGHAVIYMGAGLAVLALGRLAVEVRSQRRSRLAAERRLRAAAARPRPREQSPADRAGPPGPPFRGAT